MQHNVDNSEFTLILLFLAIVTFALYFLIPYMYREIAESLEKNLEDKIQEEVELYTSYMKQLGYSEEVITHELESAEWLQTGLRRNLRNLRHENRALRRSLKNGVEKH